ncbi:hypothetical protein TRVL_04020 [Trypanosoma vivax]|nr:hypothetical protein TRVL_04020 [Trypanosoma vivax]
MGQKGPAFKEGCLTRREPRAACAGGRRVKGNWRGQRRQKVSTSAEKLARKKASAPEALKQAVEVGRGHRRPRERHGGHRGTVLCNGREATRSNGNVSVLFAGGGQDNGTWSGEETVRGGKTKVSEERVGRHATSRRREKKRKRRMTRRRQGCFFALCGHQYLCGDTGR